MDLWGHLKYEISSNNIAAHLAGPETWFIFLWYYIASNKSPKENVFKCPEICYFKPQIINGHKGNDLNFHELIRARFQSDECFSLSVAQTIHNNLENGNDSLDQSITPWEECHSAFKGSASPLMSSEMLTSSFMLQVIQTVSAMDKDDPKNGHYFLYSLLPEMVNNPNFTIKKNEGKYISIGKQDRIYIRK